MKIDFEFETPYGKFRDALNLPDNHSYTKEELQLMKEKRRDNWIAIITNPPLPVEEIDDTTIDETPNIINTNEE